MNRVLWLYNEFQPQEFISHKFLGNANEGPAKEMQEDFKEEKHLDELMSFLCRLPKKGSLGH